MPKVASAAVRAALSRRAHPNFLPPPHRWLQGDEYTYGTGKIDAGDPNYNSEEEVGIRIAPAADASAPSRFDGVSPRRSAPSQIAFAATVCLCDATIDAQGDTTLEVSS